MLYMYTIYKLYSKTFLIAGQANIRTPNSRLTSIMGHRSSSIVGIRAAISSIESSQSGATVEEQNRCIVVKCNYSGASLLWT